MILVRLSGGGQLAVNPAASYERMSVERGRALRTNSTTRTRAEQAALYEGWVKRKPGFNFALPPGQSVHERGYAMDVDSREYAWMESYAAAHGWRRTNRREPWHYEYVYVNDTKRVSPVPIIVPRRVDEMPTFIQMLYQAYFNRVPGVYEVLFWVRRAESRGYTLTALETDFMESKPEPGSVDAAYRLFLNRDSGDAERAYWLARSGTVAALWKGVSESPERAARQA